MIGSLLALGLFGILILIMLAALAVLLVAFVIKFIIVSIIQVKATHNEAKAKNEHGKGSIGALIAEGEKAAAWGDFDKLLDTSVDRQDAIRILEWFGKAIRSGDYYCIREFDPEPGGPDYAVVMQNRSGYNFKEFKCKATPAAAGTRLSTVTCIAKDWKKNTEGQLWFHCKNPNVDNLSIEANDISYEINIDTQEDAKRREKQRTDNLIEIAQNTKPDLATRVLGDVNELPYECPECGHYYDGIECKNCGYDSIEAEAGKLDRSIIDEILDDDE